MITISGNTYKARQVLKDHGAKWHGASKTWTMTEEQWAELDRKRNPTYGRAIANACDGLVVTTGAQDALARGMAIEEYSDKDASK